MNSLFYLIPVIIGASTILQGSLNRQIASSVGILQATLISNTITTLFCGLAFYLVQVNPNLAPQFFKSTDSQTTFISTFKWWYLLPSLFGFLIINGMPFAFSKLGAVKVTVLLVAAQMITSLLWDYYVDHLTINLYKVCGLFFAFLSVVFISLAKN